MENVFFKPWIGKDYDSGGIFNKKILVLGEAHLCDAGCKDCGNIGNAEECADFTSKNCIEALLNGETASWTGTMHKFERSLVNHETGLEESRRIWNSLAFYNYVQKALDSSRKAPEWVDFQNSEKAFFEVIDELRPDLILVWGVTRMVKILTLKITKSKTVTIVCQAVKRHEYCGCTTHLQLTLGIGGIK